MKKATLFLSLLTLPYAYGMDRPDLGRETRGKRSREERDITLRVPAVFVAIRKKNIDAFRKAAKESETPLEKIHWKGFTPLMAAAARGADIIVSEMVGLFRMKGLLKKTIKATDTQGDTALHFAARENNPRSIKILLRCHPKAALCQNKKGITPLQEAAVYGSSEAFSVLLKKTKISRDMFCWSARLAGGPSSSFYMPSPPTLTPKTFEEEMARDEKRDKRKKIQLTLLAKITKKYKKKLDTTQECRSCHGLGIKDDMILPSCCGTSFLHTACLAKWSASCAEASCTPTCPTCREEITEKISYRLPKDIPAEVRDWMADQYESLAAAYAAGDLLPEIVYYPIEEEQTASPTPLVVPGTGIIMPPLPGSPEPPRSPRMPRIRPRQATSPVTPPRPTSPEPPTSPRPPRLRRRVRPREEGFISFPPLTLTPPPRDEDDTTA